MYKFCTSTVHLDHKLACTDTKELTYIPHPTFKKGIWCILCFAFDNFDTIRLRI